jgi:hypothetical protein
MDMQTLVQYVEEYVAMLMARPRYTRSVNTHIQRLMRNIVSYINQ